MFILCNQRTNQESFAAADFLTQYFSIKTLKIAELASLKHDFCTCFSVNIAKNPMPHFAVIRTFLLLNLVYWIFFCIKLCKCFNYAFPVFWKSRSAQIRTLINFYDKSNVAVSFNCTKSLVAYLLIISSCKIRYKSKTY